MNDGSALQHDTATSMRQLTLLIVEDDPGLNRLIQKLLARHGFIAEVAQSGAEALGRVGALADPLLLLDYRLPDMTASQLVLSLVQQGRSAPFIVMTGNGDERIAVEMMKLGARDYLSKGETFLDLLPTVVMQTVERIATERRLLQAERALHEAERRFGLLFQRIAIGIGLITPAGQALVANEAILRMSSYSLAELRQTTIGALFADQAVYAAAMQRVASHGSVRQIETTMQRKDGSRFPASCSFDELEIEGKQALLITIEDISERILSQQRISHLNAVLNGIRRVNRLIIEESDRDRLIQGACENLIQTFGYSTAWIVRIDPQGHVLASANAGFSQSEAIQAALASSDRLPHCARMAIKQPSTIALHRLIGCDGCSVETSACDGARLSIRLEYGGTVYGVMSVGLAAGFAEDQEEQSLFSEVARDLAFALYKIDSEAERLRAEADLQASRIHLQQTLDELEQRVAARTHELSITNIDLARAVRTKDEFLANMSHELRTPLNAILGRTEMCRDGLYGPLNLEQDQALRTVEESGHHLLDLINDVLDMAKIEAGRIELDIEPVVVEAVCAASVRLVSQQAHKKRLRLTQQLDSAVQLIYADGRRLKQILVNLLSNAVKFTPEGGAIGLEVVGDRAGETICMSVWDSGIGIAVEDLGRLFQPFVQIDSGLTRAHEGTGLGLNLVLNLARLHGGSVSVSSEPGRGSRFTVTLPWHSPGEGPGEGKPTPEASAPPAAPRPTAHTDMPLILLAEDNKTSADLISSYLHFHSLRLILASNGIEAVQLAAAAQPALILMDVQMPQLDGLEATRQIRQIPALATTPIIALTALVMPGDRERCLAAGANAYLSKPVSMRRLMQIIGSYIQLA